MLTPDVPSSGDDNDLLQLLPVWGSSEGSCEASCTATGGSVGWGASAMLGCSTSTGSTGASASGRSLASSLAWSAPSGWAGCSGPPPYSGRDGACSAGAGGVVPKMPPGLGGAGSGEDGDGGCGASNCSWPSSPSFFCRLPNIRALPGMTSRAPPRVRGATRRVKGIDPRRGPLNRPLAARHLAPRGGPPIRHHRPCLTPGRPDNRRMAATRFRSRTVDSVPNFQYHLKLRLWRPMP